MNSSNRSVRVSYTKLAGLSLGAATLVLLLTTALLAVLRPGPAVALVIALVGVVGAVVALGAVATRITRAAHRPDLGSRESAK